MLIPLKVDVPMSRRPWVNYALMAGIICVSLQGFYDERFFLKWAGIRIAYRLPGMEESPELPEGISPLDTLLFERVPRLTTKNFPLPVLAITSSFLHAGWLHLIGNMIFMWVFGNAVNYKFGHLGYLLLFGAAALLGSLAHYGFDGRPVVGASGAINGVMGAFLLFFPRNDVSILLVIYVRPISGRLSSGWIILFWLVWDALNLTWGSQTTVALWSHVIGFAAGFSIALLCAILGLIKSTEDEQTLLQVLFRRR